MPDGPRYDDDFYAWTQYQAEVLRTMRRADNRLDREHVAEEIADLGKSERDAVRSQIVRIIEHFLKLEYSPAADPRFDWMASIVEARRALGDKITATLQHDAEAILPQLYADARELAELGLRKFGEDAAASRMPPACPYTLAQIRERGWYPEPAG
ncbi:MAG TPA: DUF29 domain-containing protein [Stellaceae bacterium]|nr:DUF29 domain-containing protein [Stellaceae bacterium]